LNISINTLKIVGNFIKIKFTKILLLLLYLVCKTSAVAVPGKIGPFKQKWKIIVAVI